MSTIIEYPRKPTPEERSKYAHYAVVFNPKRDQRPMPRMRIGGQPFKFPGFVWRLHDREEFLYRVFADAAESDIDWVAQTVEDMRSGYWYAWPWYASRKNSQWSHVEVGHSDKGDNEEVTATFILIDDVTPLSLLSTMPAVKEVNS